MKSVNGQHVIPIGGVKVLFPFQVLEMNKNKFEQITSLSFHGLTNLKVLKLKRNQIKYLMDGAFFGLESIEELHLDRNRVDTVSKGALPNYSMGRPQMHSKAIIVNNWRQLFAQSTK